MISCSFATWARYGLIGVFNVESDNKALDASASAKNESLKEYMEGIWNENKEGKDKGDGTDAGKKVANPTESPSAEVAKSPDVRIVPKKGMFVYLPSDGKAFARLAPGQTLTVEKNAAIKAPAGYQAVSLTGPDGIRRTVLAASADLNSSASPSSVDASGKAGPTEKVPMRNAMKGFPRDATSYREAPGAFSTMIRVGDPSQGQVLRAVSQVNDDGTVLDMDGKFKRPQEVAPLQNFTQVYVRPEDWGREKADSSIVPVYVEYVDANHVAIPGVHLAYVPRSDLNIWPSDSIGGHTKVLDHVHPQRW